jgi:hypothetical protein
MSLRPYAPIVRAALVLAAALAFVGSPLLSGGFGGFDPHQFPVPQDDPPVQPAGYAFAIWGIIYVWLLVHAGAGISGERRRDPVWDATRSPMIVSLAIGASWIPVAKASPPWATVLIFAMLAGASLALWHGRGSEPWTLTGPLGLYAGWLTAASFVSLGVTAAGFGLGPGATGWAWIAIMAALGVAGAIQWATRAPFYAVAVAWALAAVTVRNWSADWGLATLAALGGAAILALIPIRRRPDRGREA